MLHRQSYPPGIAHFDKLQELGRDALLREAKSIETTRKIAPDAAILEAGAYYLVRFTFDRIYYNSFGSQLALLQLMDTHKGVATVEQAQSIWTDAKTKWAEIHGNRSFEQWIGFLVQASLVEPEKDRGWKFTENGALFLPYLRAGELSLTRVG